MQAKQLEKLFQKGEQCGVDGKFGLQIKITGEKSFPWIKSGTVVRFTYFFAYVMYSFVVV